MIRGMSPIFSRLAAPKVSAMVLEESHEQITRTTYTEAPGYYASGLQFSGVFSQLGDGSLVSVRIDIGSYSFVNNGYMTLTGEGGFGSYNSSGWSITLYNDISKDYIRSVVFTYDVERRETKYSHHLANLSPRYSGGGCYSSESMTVDEEAGTVFQTMDFSFGTVDSQSQFLGRWPSLGNSSRNLSIVVENDSTGESFLFIDDGKGKLSGPAGSGFYNDIAWSVQLSSPQSGNVSASVMRTCDNSTTSSNTYSTIHADSWCIPGAIDFDSLNGFRIVRRAGEGLNRPSTDLPDDSGIDGNGE